MATGSGSWTENAINKNKMILLGIVAFLVYFMYSDPANLATSVQSIGGRAVDATQGFFDALINFISEL